MRPKTRKSGVLIIVTGLLCLVNTRARAVQEKYQMSGQNCQGFQDADRTDTWYNSKGVTHNALFGTKTYFCPVGGIHTIDDIQSISSAGVDIYDGHSLARIACTLQIRKKTNNSTSTTLYSSSTRYSCSTVGGCTATGSNSFIGYNEISWSSSLPRSGSTIAGYATYDFDCDLPSKKLLESNQSKSYLMSYWVTSEDDP